MAVNTLAMPAIFSVDELVLDDSFIAFCFDAEGADVERWQQYLSDHPEQLPTLQEAKRRLLLLRELVDQNYAEITGLIDSADERQQLRQGRLRIFLRAAAIFFILFGAAAAYRYATRPTEKTATPLATVTHTNLYKTAAGEKRIFILPDKTKVILNAASELVLAPDFGNTARNVTLTGEAFFEVTHNPQLPFLVHTNRFQIKVLGTRFNVKAYPHEQNEATLIQGSIELNLNNSSKKAVRLKPDEKLVAGEPDYIATGKTAPQHIDKQTEEVRIAHINKPDGDSDQVHETAWTKNRLVIDNQSFISLQPMLERWFDIRIIFKDEESKAYVFTATFENETREEVFSALQLSYPFHFTIENNTIYVSKK